MKIKYFCVSIWSIYVSKIYAFLPQCKCGASLQTCSSVRSQRWGFSPPAGGATPIWCYQVQQTRCTHRVQAGAPFHWPRPPARPDRVQWLSPCQGQQLQYGSASPASTEVQGPPDGGVQSSTVTLPVEVDNIWRNPLMENKKIFHCKIKHNFVVQIIFVPKKCNVKG